jgi:threonine/homoserine/homoserine lactone efflux protein
MIKLCVLEMALGCAVNFLPMVTYLLVISLAPGPITLLMASSGANHGFVRSVPALAGMALGLALLVGALTVSVGNLMTLIASWRFYMALAGCSYLLWLSWGMLRAGQAQAGSDAARPMGFVGGAMFNWLNPSVWLLCLNLVMLFLPRRMAPWHASVLFTLVTFCVVLPCIACWAGGGVVIARFLGSPWRLRLFNCAMAAMLAGTALWMLWRALPAPML